MNVPFYSPIPSSTQKTPFRRRLQSNIIFRMDLSPILISHSRNHKLSKTDIPKYTDYHVSPTFWTRRKLRPSLYGTYNRRFESHFYESRDTLIHHQRRRDPGITISGLRFGSLIGQLRLHIFCRKSHINAAASAKNWVKSAVFDSTN